MFKCDFLTVKNIYKICFLLFLAVAIYFFRSSIFYSFISTLSTYADVSTNLSLRYTFDAADMSPNVRDSSGYGNHGFLVGQPATTTSAGKIAEALTFDGADDYVNAGSQSSVDNIFENGGTISAWIRPTSWGENNFGRIAEKSDSGAKNGDGYIFFINDTITTPNHSLRFNFYTNKSGATAGAWNSAQNSIALNQWQHVALVYNSSSLSNDPVFYVNGVKSPTTEAVAPSGTAMSSDAAETMYIGNNGFQTRTFAGSIDDVRIYKRALSSADIAELYAGSSPSPDVTAPVLTEVTPVPTPTGDTTPSYTFHSTEAGAISYGGACSGQTTAAVSGNNTVTFDALTDGTYSNCTIVVTDSALNASAPLSVNTFRVDSVLDGIAPAAVTSLQIYNPTVSTMALQWYSPGDDGLFGTASRYELRYSTAEILPSSWDAAISVSAPAPMPSGTLQSVSVAGLLPDTKYYFALKTFDENNNDSGFSNQVAFSTYPSTFYGGYSTVGKIIDDVREIAAAHPDITEIIDFGDTYAKLHATTNDPAGNLIAGYDLFALKITNTSRPGPKPRFVLYAGQHAREIVSPEIAMRFMHAIVEQYGINADITWLVDNREIWVIPLANPDGRYIVERAMRSPYNKTSPWLWRKNVSKDTPGSSGCDWPPTVHSHFGVDLNRNFDWSWGLVSSGYNASADPCSHVYIGPSPFSEPESLAAGNLFLSIFNDFRGPSDADAAAENAAGLLINLHSHSEAVAQPWGYTGTPAPNNETLALIGQRLANAVGYTAGQAYFAVSKMGGTLDDWLYGKLGIPSYLFELSGDSFDPAYSTVDSALWPEGHLGAFLYAAKLSAEPYRAILGPEVNSVAAVATSSSIFITASATDIGHGGTPIQGAEYYIDAPPWESGTANIMSASDGLFDSTVESLEALLPVGALSPGRHTIYVRGKNSLGNWGTVSAVFLDL